MEFQEFTGESVDSAINEAIYRLQVPSTELEYEVIAEATSGFLGFGKKPARIRARRKEQVVEVKKPAKKAPEKKEAPAKEKKAPAAAAPEKAVEAAPEKETVKETGEKKSRSRRRHGRKEQEKTENVQSEVKSEEHESKPHVEKKQEPVVRSEENIAKLKTEASVFLKDVFAAMDIPVEIVCRYIEESNSLEVDFEGDDMGLLIGKRGQTLDSLQYLTSLVVNKDENVYVRVKLDTENYRSRRKDTLENLAKNIAFRVKKTRKPVSLEPMNPYERRIIHSALQSHKFVETYSEGNEPYRHVVVALKKGVKIEDDKYYNKRPRRRNDRGRGPRRERPVEETTTTQE